LGGRVPGAGLGVRNNKFQSLLIVKEEYLQKLGEISTLSEYTKGGLNHSLK